MKISHMFAFFCLLALCSAGGILTYFSAGNSWEARGIYMHPSGQASYIEGSSCTINATQDISPSEFQKLYVWCSTMHMEALNIEPSTPVSYFD